MATNDISKGEIQRLIYEYDNKEITDELYVFGKMLLDEINDRIKQIDSKASTALGWSTAILAFLFTQIAGSRGMLNMSLGLLIGTLAFLAVSYAYGALRTRGNWQWPSDRDWFEVTALGSADELRRFHIRSMHEIRHAQRDIADSKARCLLIAEGFLVASAGILAFGIAINLLGAAFPTLFLALGDRIRMCIGSL